MAGWDALRERRFEQQKAMGLFDNNVKLSPRNPEAPPWKDAENKKDWDLRMAVYAAMVDRMDQGIGSILQKLREVGEEENTLIMFLSDNGGCAELIGRTSVIPPGPAESYTGYYLPWANASNTPFRLFKHWVHEGGIATPFIAHWPRVIEQTGEITDQSAHVMDVKATCLEAAGAEYPADYRGQYPTEDRGFEIIPTEGRSLVPVFKGGKIADRDVLYWEHEGNRAVRQGKWKLVSYYTENRQFSVGSGKRTGEWEMYDIDEDRTELNNIAETHSDKVRELSGLYEQWKARVNVTDWGDIQVKLAQG